MSFQFHPGTAPVLVSFPHSGTDVPVEIRRTMTTDALRLPDTDWHLPELYDFLDSWSPSRIEAEFSRYVIDLNRPLDGSNLYPGQPTPELCPKLCFDGSPIYQAGMEPSEAEVERRRLLYWQPYHDKIQQTLLEIRERHGYAILFDAHSIRSRVPRLFEGQLPDFNIGTYSGASCARSLEQTIADRLKNAPSASFAINGRFVGGFITRSFGQPDQQIHAVQLELSQARYLDERTNGWNTGVEATREILKSIFRSIVEWAPDLDPPNE